MRSVGNFLPKDDPRALPPFAGHRLHFARGEFVSHHSPLNHPLRCQQLGMLRHMTEGQVAQYLIGIAQPDRDLLYALDCQPPLVTIHQLTMSADACTIQGLDTAFQTICIDGQKRVPAPRLRADVAVATAANADPDDFMDIFGDFMDLEPPGPAAPARPPRVADQPEGLDGYLADLLGLEGMSEEAEGLQEIVEAIQECQEDAQEDEEEQYEQEEHKGFNKLWCLE